MSNFRAYDSETSEQWLVRLFNPVRGGIKPNYGILFNKDPGMDVVAQKADELGYGSFEITRNTTETIRFTK